MNQTPEIQVSHSQLGTYDRCAFKWFLSYELGYKPKSVPTNVTLGSLIHSFLEEHYKLVQEHGHGGFDYQASMQEFLRSQPVEKQGDLEALDRASRLIERYLYLAEIEDQSWEIIEVEVAREVEFKTPKGRLYTLVFIPDLIVRERESGRLWLVDHKTAGNAAFWSDTEIMMDHQMPTYIAGLRQEGLDIYGIVYNFLNRYDYKDYNGTPTEKLFKRVHSYRTPVEIDTMVRELGFQVDDLIENEIPRRSLRKECSRCWFQEPCLMSMKGMDIKRVLEAGFELKGSYHDRKLEEAEED